MRMKKVLRYIEKTNTANHSQPLIIRPRYDRAHDRLGDHGEGEPQRRPHHGQ